MSDALKIVKVEAENFLLLTKIDYVPRETVNIFTGVNRAGKSDFLRLLKATFKGLGYETIQHGKDKNSVLVRLSDGHEIKRNTTLKSKRFQVRTPEGDLKASPQQYIDYLLGDTDLSFDPLAFVLKDPKEQKSMLLDTFNIGRIEPDFLKDVVDDDILKLLDFSKEGLSVLKDAETLYYSRRTDINREVTQKKGHYEDLMKSLNGFDVETYNPDASEQLNKQIADIEQELSDTRAARKQAERTNKTVESLQAQIMSADQELLDIDDEQIANIETLEKRATEIEQTIAKLHRELSDMKAAIDGARKAKVRKAELQNIVRGHQDTIATLPKLSDVPDIEAIESRMTSARALLDEEDKNKARYDTYLMAQSILTEYQDKAKESEELTAKIDILRKDLPGQLTANINLPFESLSFDGDEVLINGNRLSLMSTMEQLMFSLELFLARNKNARLKLVCVDRIEVLDTEHYEYFWNWCHKNNLQAFATRVLSATNLKDEILIEDGQIIEQASE